MQFTITTLVENSVAQSGQALIAEHGLSFFIQAGDRRILFDTGQNLAISHNARELGIDLAKIDTVVLSHGHYDHSGGLQSILDANRHFTLFGHPAVFGPKVKKTNGAFKYIGIPLEKDLIAAGGVTLKLVKKSVNIAPGVITTGEIALENDFENVEAGFFLKNNSEVIHDTLADDQALVLDTAKGLVVLLGCSHRGVINTLTHISQLKPGAKLYAILGGLHLGKASDGKLVKIIDHLRVFDPQMIGVGHCTGPKAFLALANEFKDRVFLNTVGNVMVV